MDSLFIEFPFACFVCRNNFDNPVKTRCKHYFCERCALKQLKCPICGVETNRVFHYITPAERAKLEKARIKHESTAASEPGQGDEEQ